MNDFKLVWEVAKWEFKRWFKLKEQIITLAIAALISLFIFGGKNILEKFSDDEINLALINNAQLKLIFDENSKIRTIGKENHEYETLIKELGEKTVDGILVIKDLDNVELIVNKEHSWLNELQRVVNEARQQLKLKQSSISTAQLQDIFSQLDLKIIYTEAQRSKSSLGEKITAGVFIGLMLVGIFLGLAYQFVAITGEKQLRITEVIVSTITPQTWIDGKILGISLLSLVLLITYALSTIIFVVVSSLFGSGWTLPIALGNPFLISCLFLFSIGGFLLWNTFFSAIAATINNPNTSARGSLMMVPLLPIMIAFLSFKNPDSLAMKIFTFFPLTSPSVLSARLVLTEVSYIEIVISLLLLILTTWYLRKAAGKIFSTSILMYGKEPSWQEISKWIRK